MFNDLARAFRELFSPGLRGWALMGFVVALVLLLVLLGGIQVLLGAYTDTGYAWLDWTVRIVGALGSLLGTWFLFPATVLLVFGLLLDRIVDAVERQAYPGLPAPRPSGIGEAVGGTIRLGLLAVALNLLAIPLYLVPGINIATALLLNGYLIGREYFETVAMRRMTPPEARRLRKQHGGAALLSGIIVAALLLIPFVNLLAPVVGAAFFTHRFHSWMGRREAADTRSEP